MHWLVMGVLLEIVKGIFLVVLGGFWCLGFFFKLNFNLQHADFEVLFDRDSEMHVKKVQCQGTRYLESDSS